MRKHILVGIALLSLSFTGTAQTDIFDVYRYKQPQFFSSEEQTGRLVLAMKNSDTSFCVITLYKCLSSNGDTLNVIDHQWKNQVVVNVSHADSLPKQQHTGGRPLDGWSSSIALGNFYQDKKKGIVMMYSFTKENKAACVVFTFNDRIFQPVIEEFSKNLHLAD